ncbi:hypothetical protein [Novosphingobium sp. M1R2S20]|uniref:Mannose-6-phosphate isomerase n=1 Tax=Novosphingobium rhizovicinum TaxID=3228928 RepID=A0ABV3R6A3_9SPHN
MMLETLVRLTTSALKEQTAAGAMMPGRNGAYGDPETPVRNTAHWLVSFSMAYKATGDERFRHAAGSALEYLLACQRLFVGGVIVRHAGTKDKTNGVLGQAHLIEAYYYAATVLGHDGARSAALDLIARHPFDHDWGCWRRITPDGRDLPPDDTFNHQLYFAATIALWSRDEIYARDQVAAFLDHLNRIFQVRKDGRIVHAIPNRESQKSKVKGALKAFKKPPIKLIEKEANYHMYNMYAFSLLSEAGYEGRITSCNAWSDAASFASSSAIVKRKSQQFWSRGLVSGTETIACDSARFHQAFKGRESAVETVASAFEQLAFVAGPDGLCEVISPDPVTQRARLYRYWRLTDLDYQLRQGPATSPRR